MRHEQIQQVYKDHYYVAHRNMGSAKKLKGKIDVIVCFVNDSQSTWTERAKRKYRLVQKEAMQYVVKNARAKGVALQMRNAYIEASVNMVCSRENWRQWNQAVMGKFGQPDVLTFQQAYRNAHQCDEVPVLFVLNKPFRSCALSAVWETRMYGEMAIISSDYNVHTIVHELLHQFGAVDLYYPEEVKRMVDKMWYSSVMGSCTSMTIDSLTSYLIGWSEEIDRPATRILDISKHYTREYMLGVISSQYSKT